MREAPARPTVVLTVADLCEYLKVHRTTVYKLLKARKIPAFRFGGDWRFNREQIDKWRLSQNPDWAGAPEAEGKNEKP